MVTKGATYFRDIDIGVVSPSGDKIKFNVSHSDKIRDFKHMIEEKTGIDPSQQRLTFNGQELDDDRELWDYGVWHQSTIYLYLAGDSYEIEKESTLHLHEVD